MLRKSMNQCYSWSSKTMSLIGTYQADECEALLRSFPSVSLFDPSCTDEDAERLFSASFFAVEKENSRFALHQAETLKKQVIEYFPSEFSLLSMQEHELMLKLMMFSGRMRLATDHDICSAAGLLLRLWCTIETDSENRIYLKIPHSLLTAALLLLSNDTHRQIRDVIKTVDENIRDTLYLTGIMQAKGPALHLKQILEGSPAADETLISRYLMTSYDYWYDESNRLMLLHDGLADPAILTGLDCYTGDAMVEMDEDSLTAMVNSLDALEKPIYDQMRGLLVSSTRPEISPDEAVEDLVILAKQNIPLPELNNALSTMLTGSITPDMKTAVRKIHEYIPRWVTMSMGRMQ